MLESHAFDAVRVNDDFVGVMDCDAVEDQSESRAENRFPVKSASRGVTLRPLLTPRIHVTADVNVWIEMEPSVSANVEAIFHVSDRLLSQDSLGGSSNVSESLSLTSADSPSH